LTENEVSNDQLQELARRIRVHALRMTSHANASHIGSGLSMADILAVLYGHVLNVDPQNPDWNERDHFILSKGHGAATLYATLAERGFFPVDWLQRYADDHQPLAGHVAKEGVPGIELATGSLGHGLPVALGMAIACQADALPSRVFALLSDGELDEGSNWEAILLAGHLKCKNLTTIVDANAIQSFGRVSDVLELEPLADKWRAFGWTVSEVDGHDHAALVSALSNSEQSKPGVVLARTVKGKGVSFMENKLEWHYRSARGETLEKALAELGEGL
jgi:transketolase